MRKILFRGKRTDNKEWIEGCYVRSVAANCPFGYITPSYPTKLTQIYTVTLGQYTGLNDENGKKIFEGDIVKNEYEKGKYQYFRILYCDETHMWQVSNKYGMLGKLYQTIGTLEVIGNIHDNLELLNN